MPQCVLESKRIQNNLLLYRYLLSELCLITQLANKDIYSVGISVDLLGRQLIPSNNFNLR